MSLATSVRESGNRGKYLGTGDVRWVITRRRRRTIGSEEKDKEEQDEQDEQVEEVEEVWMLLGRRPDCPLIFPSWAAGRHLATGIYCPHYYWAALGH
jgi:hypothetical protein